MLKNTFSTRGKRWKRVPEILERTAAGLGWKTRSRRSTGKRTTSRNPTGYSRWRWWSRNVNDWPIKQSWRTWHAWRNSWTILWSATTSTLTGSRLPWTKTLRNRVFLWRRSKPSTTSFCRLGWTAEISQLWTWLGKCSKKSNEAGRFWRADTKPANITTSFSVWSLTRSPSCTTWKRRTDESSRQFRYWTFLLRRVQRIEVWLARSPKSSQRSSAIEPLTSASTPTQWESTGRGECSTWGRRRKSLLMSWPSSCTRLDIHSKQLRNTTCQPKLPTEIDCWITSSTIFARSPKKTRCQNQ